MDNLDIRVLFGVMIETNRTFWKEIMRSYPARRLEIIKIWKEIYKEEWYDD